MNKLNKLNEIIVSLIAIYNFAKDIHYNVKGEAFYSKHILCDRISDNLYDYIDNIKEVCFLAIGEAPLSSKEYLQKATLIIPDLGNDEFVNLLVIITKTLEQIENLTDLSKGEENLIGNIAEHLQTSLGLLGRQVQ